MAIYNGLKPSAHHILMLALALLNLSWANYIYLAEAAVTALNLVFTTKPCL
jgi:hypothetical protein